MPSLLYIGLGLIALGLLIVFAWRFASRRRSLPCPVWLRWLVELDNPCAGTYRASVIIRHLDLQPGMEVLDVGCGPGRLTIPVAEQVGPQGAVAAIDIQPGMLRRAQKKAQAANLNNIRFLQVGAGKGKLERSQFDRALLVSVLGEIPDQEAALKEVFDALKPSGILSVTEIIFDPHFQTRGAVLRLAGAVGFREQKFFGNRLAFTLNLEKPAGAQLLDELKPPGKSSPWPNPSGVVSRVLVRDGSGVRARFVPHFPQSAKNGLVSGFSE
jgi:SAM-dependent methyltransferase